MEIKKLKQVKTSEYRRPTEEVGNIAILVMGIYFIAFFLVDVCYLSTLEGAAAIHSYVRLSIGVA